MYREGISKEAGKELNEDEWKRLRLENETLKAGLSAAHELNQIAPGVFAFLSLDGRVLDVNEPLRNSLDLSKNALLNRYLWDAPWLSSLPDSAAAVREAIFKAASGLSSQFETTYASFRISPGKNRWVLLSVSPVFSTRLEEASQVVKKIAISGVDVTEQVTTRRELEASRSRLQESVRDLMHERELRDRFVATLTHDLRTPLTAALMSAQLLATKIEDREQVRSIAARIAENVSRTGQMIKDLLDASLIRANQKFPINVGPCHLNQIVSSTLEELRTIYGDRFRLEAAVPIHGYWCQASLRRVIENLCTNAVKYGSTHQPVTITLLLAARGDCVEIKVHNHGNPISPEEQSQLFEPFKRIGSVRPGAPKGWGLGLTLVKGIAEAHGGRVWVESVSSASQGPIGTHFGVVLPLDSRAIDKLSLSSPA